VKKRETFSARLTLSLSTSDDYHCNLTTETTLFFRLSHITMPPP
jgi:hypothetical protein